MQVKQVMQFKGIRNDLGRQYVPEDYFYNAYNVTQDDIAGFNKVLCPTVINDLTISRDYPIDGLYRFKYLDSNNIVQTEDIAVHGGVVYKDFGSVSPTVLYSGLTAENKCQFAILNDKLYIVNGIDYPIVYDGSVVHEMGSPAATVSTTAGSPNGDYYYAITFVTTGGEEYVGTVSNTVTATSKRVDLGLPLGYAGTTSRKIYRTAAGGSQLKLLATVANNTDLTYEDNIADGSLGANIIAVNNECPKPKFIRVSPTFQLVAIGDSSYPTQCYVADANIGVFDSASYLDITNRGDDNTQLTGMCEDYGKILLGSQKQLYLLDFSTETITVTVTRANIGVLNGYSMVKMPSNSGFAGGVMFVASDYTVRLFNGNYSAPVATTLDNLKTENWAQVLRGTLYSELQTASNIHAEYYQYKYHLIVNSKYYVFDTKTLGWNTLEFRTLNYLSYPNVLANFQNTVLYIGRRDTGIIESMYTSVTYMDEELPCYVEFPAWCCEGNLKFFDEMQIHYKKENNLSFKITVDVDDGINQQIVQTVSETSPGIFSSAFFNPLYFQTTLKKEDHKILRIHKYGDYILFRLDNFIYIRGIQVTWIPVSNVSSAKQVGKEAQLWIQ